MQTPETTMRIALLSQAGDAGRHLRDALAGSGTPIVYEAQAAELDRDALEKSGARVVVVNLDSDVEAHLDEVYALLDDDRYNVIFNEAQVSSQLSGWEQARWARHLAAKIRGTENADPPRPVGAEPVPQRVPESAPANAEIDEPQTIENPASASNAEAETLAVEPAFDGTPETVKVAEDDYSDIAALLSEVDPALEELEDASTESAAVVALHSLETVQMPELDLSEFDIDGDVETESVEMMSDGDEVKAAEIDLDDSIATLQMPGVQFESGIDSGDTVEVESDSLGFGDLDDFAGGVEDQEESDGTGLDANALESELADTSQESEAAAIGSDISGLEMLDLDWADAPTPSAAQESKEEIEDVPPPEIGSAFAWSLEELDEGTDEDTAQAVPAAASDFGIEKVSASDYLAPEATAEEAAEPINTELSLELIPLDEAVAPSASTSTAASEGRESWLDVSNKVAISRVWVLGASIGGPEAVREFLAEVPAKCPALFLLAQHMGAEFMEIMAQQLSRSTSLTVRTPSHGERVSHGDIVVVPTTHRLRVDREGVITLEALGDTNLPNTPSIDQVLQDVADRFGSKAGFIVFSGMADDAAEGSRYLAGIGGKIYAQDPETCVISSMVDGVIETGVVSFTGSPKALAGKLLGELKS